MEYGYDAAPVAKGRCCTRCHSTIVLPARFKVEGWPQDEIDAFYQRKLARTKPEGSSE